MFKFFKTFFKWTLGVLATFVLLVVFAIGFFIQRPDLVFTSRHLEWAAKQAEKQGMDVRWQGLKIEAKTPRFFRPELSFQWESLKFSKPAKLATDSAIQTEIGQAELTLKLDFLKFPPHVTQLGPISIAHGDVIFTSAAESAPETEDKPSEPFQIPSILTKVLDHAKIEPIQLGIDDFKLKNGEKIANQGSLLLTVVNLKDQTQWELHAQEKTYGKVSLVLNTPSYLKGEQLTGPFDLTGVVQSFASKTLPKPVKLAITAHANQDLSQIHLALNGTAKEVAPHVETVFLKACDIDFNRNGDKGDLNLKCPLGIQAETMKFKQYPQVYFENDIGLEVDAHVTSNDYSNFHKPVHADLALSLAPYLPLKNEEVLKTWGTVKVSGDGVPAEPTKNWKIKSDLDIQLAIAEFQDLVKILDKTPYAVPAPLRVLKGKVDFAASGSVDPQHGTVPVQFHTQLKSAQQSLLIDDSGVFSFTKSGAETHMDLKMDAILSDIELTMPHVDLKGVPKVIPDSRISAKVAAIQPNTTVFTYEIHVHTADKPIQIVTNLASAPIPIRVDVNLDSKGPPLGQINVGSFPVDVFHRKATIEKFDLTLESKKMPISGSLKVESTQYTVFVVMKGTIDQPVFQLSSEPALPQADVVSVLLFGKTSDDLDSDQADSVGSTRAAVSERSMDLASLYLLSATPIQSVGYDPATGAVSTTVTIGGGTSLNVAAGQNSLQTVGIRKRLGKNFSITTEVTSGGLDQSGALAGSTTQTGQKAVAALLEWRHRY
jgi:hypothetical protein